MIYIIGASPFGPLKIGISKNPEKRLKQLQTSSPQKLHLYASGEATFECGYSAYEMPDSAVEKVTHLWYSERRLTGEWFDIDIQFLLDDNGFGVEWSGMTGDCWVGWERTAVGQEAYDMALGPDEEDR